MMKSEFCEKTGIKYEELSSWKYSQIESAYYEFFGSKDEFCAMWIKLDKQAQDFIMQLADSVTNLERCYSEYTEKYKRASEHAHKYREKIKELQIILKNWEAE